MDRDGYEAPGRLARILAIGVALPELGATTSASPDLDEHSVEDGASPERARCTDSDLRLPARSFRKAPLAPAPQVQR